MSAFGINRHSTKGEQHAHPFGRHVVKRLRSMSLGLAGCSAKRPKWENITVSPQKGSTMKTFACIRAAFGAALLGSLFACGGGGSGDGAAPVVAEKGTLRVAMTDAPACGYDAVNVTVTKVRVHQAATAAEGEAGWQDVTVDPP